MEGLEPGTEFGGHRIESVIARGGMGVVYRATHLTLELPVALKVIAPDQAGDVRFRERFRREAQVAARIDNQHVIPVRDAGEADGLLYISMRLVDGPTISRLVSLSEGLDPETAVMLAEQVADGLDAAHAAGLVHRDVKPANVLVEHFPEQPHAYLTDFGITRRQTPADDLTMTGKFVGSIDYVAPEQIRGETVDGRADVYALAGMLSFMLTGEPPFPADSSAAKMYAHLHSEPPQLPPGSPGVAELNAVIAKGMAKDPDDRYASPGELAAAARAALEEAPTGAMTGEESILNTDTRPTAGTGSDGTTDEQPAPAAPAPPPPAPPRGPREPGGSDGMDPGRRRLLILLGGVAVIAVIVGALALGGGGGDKKGSGDGTDTTATKVTGTTGAGNDKAALAAFVTRADAICTGIETNVQADYDRNGGQMATGQDVFTALKERAGDVRNGVGALKQVDTGGLSPKQKELFRQYWQTRSDFADELDVFRESRENGNQTAADISAGKLQTIAQEKIDIGKKLGLSACGDELPDKQAKKAKTLALKWVSGDQAICTDGVSRTFLDSTYNGQTSECEMRGIELTNAKIVEVAGVENVHAQVDVEGEEGSGTVFIVDQDRTWRIDGYKSLDQ